MENSLVSIPSRARHHYYIRTYAAVVVSACSCTAIIVRVYIYYIYVFYTYTQHSRRGDNFRRLRRCTYIYMYLLLFVGVWAYIIKRDAGQSGLAVLWRRRTWPRCGRGEEFGMSPTRWGGGDPSSDGPARGSCRTG